MIRLLARGVVVALAAQAGAARAQDGEWIVAVGAVAGDETSRAVSAAATESARLRSRAETVLTSDEVERRLGERLSLPFVTATAEARDRLLAAVEPALVDVAEGRHRDAQGRVDPLLREAEAGAAALARDDDTARAIANLCMIGVRAAAELRLDQDAAERARTCVKLIPDIAPQTLFYQGNQPMHPARVRALVDEARARLASEGTEVRVEAAGASRSCTLRVSGRPLATSLPATVRLFRGTHALQVECDPAPGRVHRVTVSAYQVTVEVNPALDRVLGTSGATSPLMLTYPSAEERASRLDDDLATLASSLGAGHVAVVSTGDARGVSVRHWSPQSESESGRRPVGGASPTTDGPELVGPVVLFAVGAILAGVSVYALIAAGGCTDMEAGDCVETYELSSPAIWLWSGGALAALAGGTLWLVLGASRGSDREGMSVSFTAGLRRTW